VSSLALRLAACERRFQRQRTLLAEQHRASGGALFAEAALRDGRWAASVLPHWRGRRLRYHFADYVFLARVDGLLDRDEAAVTFADAFRRTGADWDDGPFDGDSPLSPSWKQERIYVPRLTAARAPEPYARTVDGMRGIVIAGPRWAGMYTVAALVSAALGWGRESFEFLARSLNPTGGPSVPLANELLRGWFADASESPHRVWAHILTPSAPDEPGADVAAADVRLLAQAPPDVRVVLLVPEDDPAGAGQGGLAAAARLSGSDAERLRAAVGSWRAAIPAGLGVAHLAVPTPRGRDGAPAGPADRGFLDGYFDAALEVALKVLAFLAGGAPAGTLVPAAAAAGDPFAAFAARSS